jgi:hypothetical protein
MSVDHVLDAAKTITTIRIKMPENGSFFTKTLFLTKKQLAIKPLFETVRHITLDLGDALMKSGNKIFSHWLVIVFNKAIHLYYHSWISRICKRITYTMLSAAFI